jgi:hypothetical protein
LVNCQSARFQLLDPSKVSIGIQVQYGLAILPDLSGFLRFPAFYLQVDGFDVIPDAEYLKTYNSY